MKIDSLLAKYDWRVPRYTSYPPATHFAPSVGAALYAGWLAALPDDAEISLYLHVPFCDELCLYCGCNTVVARHEAPRRAYAQVLRAEIARVRQAIGRPLRVAELHWGGGTPTSLPADCLVEITEALRQAFTLPQGTQVSVEIDPRHLAEDRLDALRRMGVTRASLGVQDFDPAVQASVGRVQPFEMVRACTEKLRDIGAVSINFDLMYGLPYQTEQGVRATVARAVSLRPDRIAAFGYAHVPWMKRQQSLLPEAALPDGASRFRQRAAFEDALRAAGYVAIGLDHFALPEDGLARAAAAGVLHRNFQGYTTDQATVLIGLGASAIGSLPAGYLQNHAAPAAYMAAIRAGRLATTRGVALRQEDRLRRHVIEQVMCYGQVDLREAAALFASDPDALLNDAAALAPLARDGLVTLEASRVRVTEAGRPFMRMVAACFDGFWVKGGAQHSTAI